MNTQMKLHEKILQTMMKVIVRLPFREDVNWVGQGLTNCLVFCVEEGPPGS